MSTLIKVLSIAGSDPSSGAGIQADLKTFQCLGAFGMAVPAALTVQNSRGVSDVEPISHRMLTSQLDSLLSDCKPAAVKTGMLLTRKNVESTSRVIRHYGIRNLIVDPVLKSSSGAMLLQKPAINSLLKELLPLARIVTPNIPEAEILSQRSIRSEQDMDYAAGSILDLGPSYVLIKGGHKRGPAVDTLYGGKKVLTFSTVRRNGNFHGTGCALSAALTVFIAQGLSVEKAVEKAKQFVDSMLKTALLPGSGKTKYFQFQNCAKKY